MNQLKLMTPATLLFILLLSSCDKKDDTRLLPDTSRYINNYNFFLSGSQVVPANASTATGYIQGTYDRKTKLYSYVINWSNLSSTVTAIHIHGIADAGYNALPSPLGPFPNSIVQNITGFSTAKSGSYTGNLFVDGVVVKEADLLASKFYVDIHTTNFPLTTTGEIRGQIIFP